MIPYIDHLSMLTILASPKGGQFRELVLCVVYFIQFVSYSIWVAYVRMTSNQENQSLLHLQSKCTLYVE